VPRILVQLVRREIDELLERAFNTSANSTQHAKIIVTFSASPR